jgi:hypothetical protein
VRPGPHSRGSATHRRTRSTKLPGSSAILDLYKKETGEWSVYEPKFLALMRERRIEESMRKELFDGGCLLCSEDQPQQCHWRLVAEYLAEKWGNVEIVHIA